MPRDRALVEDAAVLGQSFTLAGLAAVSGQPPADLEPRLRGAGAPRAARSSTTTRARRSAASTRFVQALIREVAYNTLSQQGPQGPPPRGGALLREPRDGRARRRARRPLPRGAAARRRRRGGQRARGAGADRAPRRRRAGRHARLLRPGADLPRAGARRHHGSGGSRRAARKRAATTPVRASRPTPVIRHAAAAEAERRKTGRSRGDRHRRRGPRDGIPRVPQRSGDGAVDAGAAVGGVLRPRADHGGRGDHGDLGRANRASATPMPRSLGRIATCPSPSASATSRQIARGIVSRGEQPPGDGPAARGR